jgi:hypothetical protein
MKKNPIHHLLDRLPADGSKIIITDDLKDKILFDLKHSELYIHSTHKVVDRFLDYLVKHNIIKLDYNGVIQTIQKVIHGN